MDSCGVLALDFAAGMGARVGVVHARSAPVATCDGSASPVNVYRCDWCGRFYSSPLPDESACQNHIPEHNKRHMESIKRFNAKPLTRAADKDDE